MCLCLSAALVRVWLLVACVCCAASCCLHLAVHCTWDAVGLLHGCRYPCFFAATTCSRVCIQHAQHLALASAGACLMFHARCAATAACALPLVSCVCPCVVFKHVSHASSTGFTLHAPGNHWRPSGVRFNCSTQAINSLQLAMLVWCAACTGTCTSVE
jgi:hypothetical protein